MLQYGDISPAVAAYSVVRMLKRAMPLLQLEKFGQTYVLPTNSARRPPSSAATTWQVPPAPAGSGSGSFNIPTATTPLVEGVTPSGNTLANQDYTVQLAQYGDWIPITDVVMDTHTDDVLLQAYRDPR
jgi:N4-gp56 family major capsid protein